MTASFLAAWWAQGIVLAALLAVAALLLQWIARDAVPARAIWGAALLGSTLLTMGAPFRLAMDVGSGAAVSALAVPPAAEVAQDAGVLRPMMLARAVRRLLDAPGALAAASVRALPGEAARGAFAVWWLVATALGLALFASHRRLRRALRDAESHSISGVPVRLTSRLGPAVVGVRAPVIVMPRWLLGLPAADQALVVRHERSHVAAADPLLLALGVALAALQPWNPATWFMLSRLRLAIELDCDRRLLRDGTTPRAYGDLLIALAAAASPASRPAVLHPMFSHHRSHLAQRIIAMTERPVRLVTTRRIIVSLLGVLAVATACESRLPTDAEVAAMDAGTALQRVSGVAGFDPAAVRYVVDGVPATREEAMGIPAHRITGVSLQNGSAEVHITTGSLALRADTLQILRRTDTATPRPTPGPGEFGRGFTGVLLIDGVRVPNTKLNELAGDRIESVEVIKGAAAVRVYGRDAEGGAIVVRTKRLP